jgi:carbamoyl-phosphate synthase small subunit
VPLDRPAGSLDEPFESGRVQVQGVVCVRHSERPHHHAIGAHPRRLAREEVPALEGIDTRTLTRKLREHGTMRGWLLHEHADPEGKRRADASTCPTVVAQSPRCASLSLPRRRAAHPAGGHRVQGQHRPLAPAPRRHGAARARHADLAALAPDFDGVLLSNGPGDPKDRPLAEQVRGPLDKGIPPSGCASATSS